MSGVIVRGKEREYDIDPIGFLIHPEQWTRDFAETMAPDVGIYGGLTAHHWEVIRSIREHRSKTGQCPQVFAICRQVGLDIAALRELFPSGYLRGACKLAGITYWEAYLGRQRNATPPLGGRPGTVEKSYRIDLCGFLLDPGEWDEAFAENRAEELKLPGGLTERHWQVIGFLRAYFKEHGVVPTVYDTCERTHLTIEELESLFPDGYHRGAVKLAGLRLTVAR